MLFSWFDTRLAKIGFAIALIAITILALMPAEKIPPIGSGWDKLDHWTAFFTLSFLAAHAFPKRPFWQIALALVAYGVGIEVGQFFTGRDADAVDVVADSIGISIYWLIFVIAAALMRSRARSE